MRKYQVALWAVGTFTFAFLLFRWALPVFNRLKESESLATAYGFLLLPFIAQLALLTAGAIYSSRTKRREVVSGILLGIGIEFACIAVLVIISASAFY